MASQDLAMFLSSAIGSFQEAKAKQRQNRMEEARLRMMEEESAQNISASQQEIEASKDAMLTQQLQRDAMTRQMQTEAEDRARQNEPVPFNVPGDIAGQVPGLTPLPGPATAEGMIPAQTTRRDLPTAMDVMRYLQGQEMEQKRFGLAERETNASIASSGLQGQAAQARMNADLMNLDTPMGNAALRDYIMQTAQQQESFLYNRGDSQPYLDALLQRAMPSGLAGGVADPNAMAEYQAAFAKEQQAQIAAKRQAYINAMSLGFGRASNVGPEDVQDVWRTFAPEGVDRQTAQPFVQSLPPGQDWWGLLGMSERPNVDVPALDQQAAPSLLRGQEEIPTQGMSRSRKDSIYQDLELRYGGK